MDAENDIRICISPSQGYYFAYPLILILTDIYFMKHTPSKYELWSS